MGTRETRIGENESLFRSVNETIKDAAVDGQYKDQDLPGFVCECGYIDCGEIIYLALEQYREVRESPARFFVVPGHEIEGAEKVVQENEKHFVVEKIGDAKEVAVERAPESNGET